MEISSKSSDSESDSDNPEEPSRKKARTEATSDEAAAPKWSNPDPYTACPPPDETTKRKKDFVQLIRKARVEEDEAKAAATAKPENFISFDFSDDEEQSTQANSSRKPSPPYEPPPPLPPGPAPSTLPPKPPSGPRDTKVPETQASQDRNGNLGSRKRTVDDEIKPPDYQIKKTNMKASKGTVSAQWSAKKNEDPCPWATVDHSATRDMAFRSVY